MSDRVLRCQHCNKVIPELDDGSGLKCTPLICTACVKAGKG